MTIELQREPTPDEIASNNRLGLNLQRAVSVVLIALGLFVAVSALELSYYTPVGPGPGFFPLWLGIVLMALALASLVLSFVSKVPPVFEEAIIPEPRAGIAMAINFAMVAFFGLTIVPLGFVPSMFVVLLVLLLINRVAIPVALAVALGGSLGVGYAFSNWLHVYLPAAPGGALSAIGL
jgi:putative tricarboxylic transport membrane protein